MAKTADTEETAAAPAPLTFAALNFKAASEQPFEFEFLLPGDEPSGFFLSIIGSQSDTIEKASNALTDNERRAELVVAAQAAKARADHPPIRPVAETIKGGREMVAKRIVGWRGIDVPYSPEKALELVNQNLEVYNQVLKNSNDIRNFVGKSQANS